MIYKKIEVNTVNRFLGEEVPKSIGIVYPPEEIKKYFNIYPEDGIWRVGKEK